MQGQGYKFAIRVAVPKLPASAPVAESLLPVRLFELGLDGLAPGLSPFTEPGWREYIGSPQTTESARDGGQKQALPFRCDARHQKRNLCYDYC